jgi:hypothetical protein
MKIIQPVTAENIGFPLLHRAHSRAEQPVAQDPNNHDHGNYDGHGGAALGMKGLREHKEEDQRKQIIEEQHRLLAHGQFQIECDQCFVGVHSRRLFPVSSMNTSSSVGCLR